MRLGAHESTAGGLYRAFERAHSVDCDTVQIFVKSNRAWAARPLTEEDISQFKAQRQETNIQPVIGHASYLLNLASPVESLWTKSLNALIIELERCEALSIAHLVLHPGAHVGSGEDTGLARVAQALGEVHAATGGFRVKVLLETTAGQGTSLGHRFWHLAWLIDHTREGERLGVCLDTCHVFAAGYDLRTPEAYATTMDSLDREIGLGQLHVVHLNDSKGELGSRKDRHEHLGKGYIGLQGFRHLLRDPRLAQLPGLLETPKSADLHEDLENLAILRSLAV